MNRRHFLPAALVWPAAAWAQAQDLAVQVEGQVFAARARVAGAELLLNGTGVRAVAWFKGYAAGLYLPRRAADAEQAATMAGAKRLQLRMLQEVPAAEFVKAFKKGMERNVGAAALPLLAERMVRFEAIVSGLGTVHKRDVVDLDFEPGRGTVFSLNGTLRGDAIAGDDFYATLLRSFVGEHPYDDRLKAGLLGHKD